MTATIVLLSAAFLVCGVLAILFFTRNKNLNSKLAQEEARNEALSVEVESLEKTRADLDRDLKQEKQRNETLSRNLVDVSQSNENALWLLYVSEQSLKFCGAELYRERSRATNLEKVYREFCEEVRSKAKRRAWTKSTTAILGLFGLGVIGVFSDLGEAVNAATEAAGEIASGISEAIPELPSGIWQEGSAIREGLEQNRVEINQLVFSDPENFVTTVLERVNDVVEPIMKDERVKAIKNIVDLLTTANKLKNLGVQAYDFHRTLNLEQGKNARDLQAQNKK